MTSHMGPITYCFWQISYYKQVVVNCIKIWKLYLCCCQSYWSNDARCGVLLFGIHHIRFMSLVLVVIVIFTHKVFVVYISCTYHIFKWCTKKRIGIRIGVFNVKILLSPIGRWKRRLSWPRMFSLRKTLRCSKVFVNHVT